MENEEIDPLEQRKKETIREADNLIKMGKSPDDKSGLISLFDGSVGCGDDDTFVDIQLDIDAKGQPNMIHFDFGYTTLHLSPCMLDGLARAFNFSNMRFVEYIETLPPSALDQKEGTEDED